MSFAKNCNFTSKKSSDYEEKQPKTQVNKMKNPKQQLENLLQSGNIPHALLFSGPKGAGTSQAALHFATDLLQTSKKPETHPDIHLYFPEGKVGMYPIETIRNLSQEVSFAPYEGKWKVFILHEAEKMLPTSSNALLKTLEEPTPCTVIILISHQSTNLLPTIRSRLQTIEFPLCSQIVTDPSIISILADSSPPNFSNFESDQPDTIFETILLWFRDRMLLEIGNCEQYLHFPEHLTSLKNTPYIPLATVEKNLSLARLAHSRSTKLSTCLEMFFLAIAT